MIKQFTHSVENLLTSSLPSSLHLGLVRVRRQRALARSLPTQRWRSGLHLHNTRYQRMEDLFNKIRVLLQREDVPLQGLAGLYRRPFIKQTEINMVVLKSNKRRIESEFEIILTSRRSEVKDNVVHLGAKINEGLHEVAGFLPCSTPRHVATPPHGQRVLGDQIG